MKERVSPVHSIGAKISGLSLLFTVVTSLLIVWTYAPVMEDTLVTTADNYLNDVSVAYGSWLEANIDDGKIETTLSEEFLTKYLAGVSVSGMESSYVYVVDSEGTMLYHPTAEKIGEPVENSVVKGIVADIAAGNEVVNGVISYEYNGVTKHAATYVNDTQDFVLIVTADEDEVLDDLDYINSRVWKVIVFAVILCILLSGWLVLFITKPIMKISGAVVSLSEMNFTEPADAAGMDARKDELGIMARALSTLRGELISVVDTIRSSSELLTEASNILRTDTETTSSTMSQVDSAVGDIANGASSQAEETQRASENVIMIGDMVENTSTEVREVMEYAAKMQEANNEARSIVKSLGEINERAEQYIDVIAQQTNETNASALKIGDATKIIAEIAQQTNLLSLNASIEAARAGEQGKGFAVVASEIQKLAEQSTASAGQIKDILNMLLADSEKAVETMQQVKEIIHEQSEYMERTDVAFENMNQGVQQSIQGMEGIAARTKNLDDARVNVVDVVNNLTAIAEENAAATQETSASLVEVTSIVSEIADKVEELHQIADELDNKIQIFQI